MTVEAAIREAESALRDSWSANHTPILGKSYLQHRLYEILHRQFGADLRYECCYQELGSQSEIDLAVVTMPAFTVAMMNDYYQGEWLLAMEIKWINAMANSPSGKNSPASVKVLPNILSDVYRLAIISHDRDGMGQTPECWFVMGGLRFSFESLYNLYKWRTPQQQIRPVGHPKYSQIAEFFLPLVSTTEISLREPFKRPEWTDIISALRVKFAGRNIPDSIRVQPVNSFMNDDTTEDFPFRVSAWRKCDSPGLSDTGGAIDYAAVAGA